MGMKANCEIVYGVNCRTMDDTGSEENRRRCDEPSPTENNAPSSKASTASASLTLGTFIFSRSWSKSVNSLKIFIRIGVFF